MEPALLHRQAQRPERPALPEVPKPRSRSTSKKLSARELSELSEQAIVVSKLRRAGHLVFAVPNGHVRTKRQHIQAKHEGVSAGVPDLIIPDPPPNRPDCFATALEMKRAHAAPSELRDTQVEWLDALAHRHWAAVVGLGADDALAKLRALGYRV